MSFPTHSLISAANAGDVDAVRDLLAEGADPNGVIQGGQTPLICAVIGGYVDIVRLLVNAGANVRLKDNLGLTAFDWSERRGHWSLKELLAAAATNEQDSSVTRKTGQNLNQDTADLDAGSERLTAAPTMTPAPHTTGLQEQREFTSTEEARRAEHDRKWIEGQRRIIADQERRKREAALRQSQSDETPATEQPVHSPWDGLRETKAWQELRATEKAEPRSPWEAATISLEPEGPTDSEQVQLLNVEEPDHSSTMSDVEHVQSLDIEEPEQYRTASDIDQIQSLTSEAPEHNTSPAAVESPTAAPRESVIDALLTQTPDQPSPTLEQARIQARQQIERILEEFQERVEEEAYKRFLTDTLESPHPESQAVDEVASLDQPITTPPASVESADSATWLRPTIVLAQPIPPPPVETVPERPRTPVMLLSEESVEDILDKASNPARWVPPSLSKTKSTPATTPFTAFPEAHRPTSWARPTLWVLIGVTLLASAFGTYLLTSRLTNRAAGNPVTSAPAAVAEAPKTPVEIKKDLPTVGGALSGMELSVPEPEYPPQAKSEGVSGTITVRVDVNQKGRVILVRSTAGDWRLRAAAVKAAQKATFSPEKLAAHAGQRKVSGIITYHFVAQPESQPVSGSQSPTQADASNAADSSATGTPATDVGGTSSANVGGNYPQVGGPLAGTEKNLPLPDYPQGAKRQGISGTITVVVRVNRLGRVISWRTLEGDNQLRAAALKAAKLATFSPEKLAGKGERNGEVVGTITYNFKP